MLDNIAEIDFYVNTQFLIGYGLILRGEGWEIKRLVKVEIASWVGLGLLGLVSVCQVDLQHVVG